MRVWVMVLLQVLRLLLRRVASVKKLAVALCKFRSASKSALLTKALPEALAINLLLTESNTVG